MIQLSLPTQDSSWNEVNPNTIDVKVLILYPFLVEADANGNSFDIKEEDVQAIHDKYNKSLKGVWNKLKRMGKDTPLKQVETVANLLDHDPKALNVVGRVIGELEIVKKDGTSYLFATLRVKGKDNVERVKDKRFSQVSIGFDPATHELFEISWVVNGAIPGAQAIMSDGAKLFPTVITNTKEYNQNNLLNLKVAMLSKYDSHRNKMEEIKNEIEIESMLTTLAIGGKLLPRDKFRIKSQLNKITDKKARFEAFNLLAENLITVVDYGIRAKNKSSINWEENLMPGTKGNGMLDLQKIAANCAANLGKGKSKMSDGEDKGSKLSEENDKGKMSEGDKDKKEFGKKDLKHCLSIEDKEELGKYLSTFLAADEEDDDAAMSEEKEKAKFSEEVKKLNSEYAELKKQNGDILEKIAILSKGTEETKALFSAIIAAQKD